MREGFFEKMFAVILISFVGIFLLLSIVLFGDSTHGSSFVMKRIINTKDDGPIIWMQPMLVPNIAFRQISGPKQINEKEILLNCKQGFMEKKYQATDGEHNIITGTITCDERRFEILGIFFEDTEEAKQ